MSPDPEEQRANELEKAQDLRWLFSSRNISFWRSPDEVAVQHEIASLRKMSRSYQARHGWPPNGLAPSHWSSRLHASHGGYSISRELLAQMVAAHTSGLFNSIPEQADFDNADAMIKLLEENLKR